MIAVKRVKELDKLPGEINSTVHDGEGVLVRITRSGFHLDYLPFEGGGLRSFAPVHPSSPEEMSRRSDCAVYLAEQDGRFCGLACVKDLGSGWAEITDLRVDASERRMGVGRALVDSCRGFAERRGLGGLCIAVSDANAVLCQFLQHVGFTLEGLDRQALALTPEERAKPRLQRASVLYFYFEL